MIPALALMIGSYIILRCFDIALRPPNAFASSTSRAILVVLSLKLRVFTTATLTTRKNAGHWKSGSASCGASSARPRRRRWFLSGRLVSVA